MKVVADKDLFDRWRMLGEAVKNLSAIVQNDVDLPLSDIVDFDQASSGVIDDLEDLRADTLRHIRG